MSLFDEFVGAMVRYSGKKVSKTDISKGAYVVTEEQQRLFESVNIFPVPQESRRLIPVYLSGANQVLESSYYGSIRKNSGRSPEVRMGRGLMSWIQQGDDLYFGTDGVRIFAFKKTNATSITLNQERTEEDRVLIGQSLGRRRLAELVQQAGGPPARRATESAVFERNGYVREFARQRSEGHCELPDCNYVGFIKADGTRYNEVHHIQFMGEQGEDVIGNVAAVCPNCHARAHFAEDREQIRETLLEVVANANRVFLAEE